VVDFVEEVEEQLRAERYNALARRAAPWFVVALVATILGWLGVWGFHVWRDRNLGAASVAYDKGVAALASGDQTGGYTDFAPIAKDGPAAYRTLALIQQGNIRMMAGKAEEAAALYDSAARVAPNVILGDLARLKAALALMDSAPFPQLQTRLSALIGQKKPYDLQAREALALARLQVGKLREARNDFNALTLTLGVSQSMRARAQTAIALIDSGQAAVAGSVVRAAATLPPPSASIFAPSTSQAPPSAGAAGGGEADSPPSSESPGGEQ